MRTCVGCRRLAQSSELYRVARGPSGEIEVGRNLPGRGAWLCLGSKRCAEAALRKGVLERALGAAPDKGAGERLALKLEQFDYRPSQGASP